MSFTMKAVQEWDSADVSHWLHAGYSGLGGWAKNLSRDYRRAFACVGIDTGEKVFTMTRFQRQDFSAMRAICESFGERLIVSDQVSIVNDIAARVAARPADKADAGVGGATSASVEYKTQVMGGNSSVKKRRVRQFVEQAHSDYAVAAPAAVAATNTASAVVPNSETAANETKASHENREAERYTGIRKRQISRQSGGWVWEGRFSVNGKRYTFTFAGTLTVDEAARAYDRERLKFGPPASTFAQRPKLNLIRAAWADTLYPEESEEHFSQRLRNEKAKREAEANAKREAEDKAKREAEAQDRKTTVIIWLYYYYGQIFNSILPRTTWNS